MYTRVHATVHSSVQYTRDEATYSTARGGGVSRASHEARRAEAPVRRVLVAPPLRRLRAERQRRRPPGGERRVQHLRHAARACGRAAVRRAAQRLRDRVAKEHEALALRLGGRGEGSISLWVRRVPRRRRRRWAAASTSHGVAVASTARGAGTVAASSAITSSAITAAEPSTATASPSAALRQLTQLVRPPFERADLAGIKLVSKKQSREASVVDRASRTRAAVIGRRSH